MLETPHERDIKTRVSKERDDLFAEAITGWATNRLFPIPRVPNRYLRLPWRRILKSRGTISGILFIARILAAWPFEMLIEFLRPANGHGQKSNQHLVSQFNHGDHVCFLYRSEAGLQEMLARYVAEGLAKGEQCVCVETTRVQEKLRVDLRSLGIEVEKEIDRGALVFFSEDEVYFIGGEFNPEALMNRLAESINTSLQNGFTGFRISGEISRASGDPVLQEKVLDYERRVDEYFADKKAIGFCHYRFDKFPQKTLHSVVDAHACHIVDAYRVEAAQS
jgi:MEDS: MEthanogen/methylotroph, DcmR Sensory domain